MADEDAAPAGKPVEVPEPPSARDPESRAIERDSTAASHVGLALIVGLMVVLVLGGLAGWWGFRAHQSHQIAQQRDLFLQVGRQGAVDLTTLDYQRIDSGVQRVLGSATGPFRDEFRSRAPGLVNAITAARSASVGTVTAAALESVTPNEAEVLIALSVKTVIAGQPDQPPRPSRMRILVRRIDDRIKVSNVELVQ